MFSLRRITAVGMAVAAVAVAAGPAGAATRCVGPGGGCFAQLQPAIDASADGDTIVVAPGTYAGGITIDRSVRLQGAGAGATVIRGGGPVVTIFRATAPDQLNVSIDGVTITGGVNSTQPDHEVTFGGGVLIPVAQLDHPPFNGTGAIVSISSSEITGNVVTSHTAIPPGFCGQRSCGFNDGGGIDNGGVLTLTNTRVTNNTAGSTASAPSAASDAGAGGIDNRNVSTLVLRNSVVSNNHVVVNSAISDEASSGGIGSVGTLDVEGSVVSGNTVDYVGSTVFDNQSANAGGILVDESPRVPHPVATIRDTQIRGNSVTGSNANAGAFPGGFGGGVVAFAPILLERVQLSGNSVAVSSAAFAIADGGGMEVDAPVTMRDSVVARNSVTAQGDAGAIGFGGGLAMFGGDLTLERTVVNANSVAAAGAVGLLPFGGTSSAFGGGIANGGPTDIPPATLTLTDSVVNGNRLSGASGFLVEGGGVFNGLTVTRTRSVIAGNKPDDCFGC